MKARNKGYGGEIMCTTYLASFPGSSPVEQPRIVSYPGCVGEEKDATRPSLSSQRPGYEATTRIAI